MQNYHKVRNLRVYNASHFTKTFRELYTFTNEYAFSYCSLFSFWGFCYNKCLNLLKNISKN